MEVFFMVDKRAKSNFLLKPIILKTKSVTAVKRKRKEPLGLRKPR